MSEEKTNANEPGGQIVHISRRRELDVLTTLIVFRLMFFHTSSIFSGHQLIAKRNQSELTTIPAPLVVSSEFIWIMPVMMLVAGIAVWHSLERRTPSRFIPERLLRLGVPFLTGLGIDPWTGREGPAVILRLIKGRTSWCLSLAVVGITTRIGQREPVKGNTPALASFWSRLAATLLVHELLVRRIGMLRVLFGMRHTGQVG